jgi:Domain of unknown function (DUF5979)
MQKRARFGVLGIVGVIALATMSWAVVAGPASADPKEKVTICHATDSQSNPYVVEEPAKDGDVSGHAGHTGPIWHEGISPKWGDIIPPFEFDGGSFPGLNASPLGLAILANGCNPVGQLSVTKAFVAAPAGATGVPTSFSATVTCSDGTTATVTFPGTGGAGTPASVFTKANATCTVVEAGTASFPTGSVWTYSPATANTSGVTVNANNINVDVTITNNFSGVQVLSQTATQPTEVVTVQPTFTG